MEGLRANSFPDSHLPLVTTTCPPLSVKDHSYSPSGANGRSPDAVADLRSRKFGILYLDALQICSANREIREVQTREVSTQQPQQCNQIRRSIALRGVGLFTQLIEQAKQLPLHF